MRPSFIHSQPRSSRESSGSFPGARRTEEYPRSPSSRAMNNSPSPADPRWARCVPAAWPHTSRATPARRAAQQQQRPRQRFVFCPPTRPSTSSSLRPLFSTPSLRSLVHRLREVYVHRLRTAHPAPDSPGPASTCGVRHPSGASPHFTLQSSG